MSAPTRLLTTHLRDTLGVRPAERARARIPSRQEAQSLARLLDPLTHWRLFPELRQRALYLDIETTGLDIDDTITVVGLSDGHDTRLLVRGLTLHRRTLAQVLADARLLVTFGGASFDLPRLRRHFPGLPWELPHFDLAIGGRQVGLKGGLKAIERTLGEDRDQELTGLDGAGAITLWREWETHADREALSLLLRYCRADVQSLIRLAPKIHRRLVMCEETPNAPVSRL